MEFAREVFEFVERLGRLSSISGLMDETGRILARFGLEHFSFSGVPINSASMPDVVLAHRIPAELFRLYVARRYADVDPMLRLLRRTIEPFHWLDIPYDREREPKAAELMDLGREFGISQGLIVPIPSVAGVYGNVWMSGPKPELTARTKPALHLIGLYAFGQADRLAGPPKQWPPLTAREREVLRWIAAGKSAWEVGEILGIAKRTVDEHAQTVVRKLGAANRTQAVVIAIQNRLIEI
jgi:LuxR family quorum sensing-dependent transcriptional regulator